MISRGKSIIVVAGLTSNIRVADSRSFGPAKPRCRIGTQGYGEFIIGSDFDIPCRVLVFIELSTMNFNSSLGRYIGFLVGSRPAVIIEELQFRTRRPFGEFTGSRAHTWLKRVSLLNAVGIFLPTTTRPELFLLTLVPIREDTHALLNIVRYYMDTRMRAIE